MYTKPDPCHLDLSRDTQHVCGHSVHSGSQRSHDCVLMSQDQRSKVFVFCFFFFFKPKFSCPADLHCLHISRLHLFLSSFCPRLQRAACRRSHDATAGLAQLPSALLVLAELLQVASGGPAQPFHLIPLLLYSPTEHCDHEENTTTPPPHPHATPLHPMPYALSITLTTLTRLDEAAAI